MLLFLHKHIKTLDHNEPIRSCSKHEFFILDYINTCENIQSLGTQLTINRFSISKLKYDSLNSFSQLLLLLPGDIGLNPGLIHQGTLLSSNQWNVFKKKGLHFIHPNIKQLLLKIEELRFIQKSTNVEVIGVFKIKLDASVLKQEIGIDDYKILRCDRNRHGGGVACYITNNLSYIVLSVFTCKIENIFFEIVGTYKYFLELFSKHSRNICCPQSQNNFLKLLFRNFNQIKSVDNVVYILRKYLENFRKFMLENVRKFIFSVSLRSTCF